MSDSSGKFLSWILIPSSSSEKLPQINELLHIKKIAGVVETGDWKK